MSGWTTVTIDARDDESAEQLRDAFDERTSEYDGPRGDGGSTVNALVWGYGSETTMSILKDHTALWESAVVMECNDTTDSGDGTAYVSEGGTVSRVDTATGVESARGHDAAKQLEHHVSESVYMR